MQAKSLCHVRYWLLGLRNRYRQPITASKRVRVQLRSGLVRSFSPSVHHLLKSAFVWCKLDPTLVSRCRPSFRLIPSRTSIAAGLRATKRLSQFATQLEPVAMQTGSPLAGSAVSLSSLKAHLYLASNHSSYFPNSHRWSNLL